MELRQRNAGPIVVLDVKRPSADDAATQTALRDRLRSLLDQGCKLILLNVADVVYVDSVILSAIVQGYASAIRQGGTLKLVHVTARLRKLLKITKLDTVIDSYDSEDEATASFHVDAT